MTVAQTFLSYAGRLAYILGLSCAIILCAIMPSLFAAEEKLAVTESDQNAANISRPSDSALPAADCDSFDERSELTGGWFPAQDRWCGRGVTLDTNLTHFYQGVASGGKEQVFE